MISWLLRRAAFSLLLLGCSALSSTFRSFRPKAVEMNRAVCKSLVICGPSGVGKGTLIAKLLQQYPEKFGLSVSHTSPGVHYHFVDREAIKRDIAAGPFKYLEHAEVHSNTYGTREDDVARVHDAGKLCLLDVDLGGVMQIKSLNYPAKMIFIAPPSFDSLESRLRARATESEEQMQIRLGNARAEIEYGMTAGNFDSVVVNKDLPTAYEDLLGHIRSWFPALLPAEPCAP
jgi:guanylate kinase